MVASSVTEGEGGGILWATGVSHDQAGRFGRGGWGEDGMQTCGGVFQPYPILRLTYIISAQHFIVVIYTYYNNYMPIIVPTGTVAAACGNYSMYPISLTRRAMY